MDHWNDENNPESGIADPVFPSHDIQASEDRAISDKSTNSFSPIPSRERSRNGRLYNFPEIVA